MAGIVKKVSVKDDGHHDAMPKNVTMRYDFEKLKKVRDFDEWVDEKLEDLSKGVDSMEIDYEDVVCLPEEDREPYLKSLLKGVSDHRKRDKFIVEYLAKAANVSDVLASAAEGLPRPKLSPIPSSKGESSKKSKKKDKDPSDAGLSSPKSSKKSAESKSSKSSKSSSKDKKSKK